MWQKISPVKTSSFRESVDALKDDIRHANTIAASLPRDYGGESVQFVLSYSPLAPILMFFVQWMGYRCTDCVPTNLGILHILVHKVCMDGLSTVASNERKATPREFYGQQNPLSCMSHCDPSQWDQANSAKWIVSAAVIYPSLKLLDDEFTQIRDNNRNLCMEVLLRGRSRDSVAEIERNNECEICMERQKNMVLPGCRHSMCINCFNDWCWRSESCPFCRGSLEGSEASDLVILASEDEVIDTVSLTLENLRRLYLCIESFPTVIPASPILLLDYMI